MKRKKSNATFTQTLSVLLLLSNITFANYSLQAQGPQPNRTMECKNMSPQERENANARIQKEKKNYIEKNFSLTSAEATKFWPIYNTFEEIRKNNRPRFQKNDSLQKLSDAEQTVKAREMIAHKEKMLQSEIKYLKDLQTILEPTRIVELWKIEKDFHREVIKSVKGEGRHGDGKKGDKKQTTY